MFLHILCMKWKFGLYVDKDINLYAKANQELETELIIV